MTEPIPGLTKAEKAYFDTMLGKAASHGGLILTRMLLDGKPVAVVGTMVHNRFTGKPEGMMALSIIVDEDMAERLADPDGTPGAVFSPHDLDASR